METCIMLAWQSVLLEGLFAEGLFKGPGFSGAFHMLSSHSRSLPCYFVKSLRWLRFYTLFVIVLSFYIVLRPSYAII